MRAPEAPERFTKKVSFGSSRRSPITCTVTVRVVVPTGKVSDPDVEV